jgi:hypothetical protein
MVRSVPYGYEKNSGIIPQFEFAFDIEIAAFEAPWR